MGAMPMLAILLQRLPTSLAKARRQRSPLSRKMMSQRLLPRLPRSLLPPNVLSLLLQMASTVSSMHILRTYTNIITDEDNKKPKKKVKTDSTWTTVNNKKEEVKKEEQDSAFEDDESEEAEGIKAEEVIEV